MPSTKTNLLRGFELGRTWSPGSEAALKRRAGGQQVETRTQHSDQYSLSWHAVRHKEPDPHLVPALPLLFLSKHSGRFSPFTLSLFILHVFFFLFVSLPTMLIWVSLLLWRSRSFVTSTRWPGKDKKTTASPRNKLYSLGWNQISETNTRLRINSLKCDQSGFFLNFFFYSHSLRVSGEREPQLPAGVAELRGSECRCEHRTPPPVWSPTAATRNWTGRCGAARRRRGGGGGEEEEEEERRRGGGSGASDCTGKVRPAPSTLSLSLYLHESFNNIIQTFRHEQ